MIADSPADAGRQHGVPLGWHEKGWLTSQFKQISPGAHVVGPQLAPAVWQVSPTHTAPNAQVVPEQASPTLPQARHVSFVHWTPAAQPVPQQVWPMPPQAMHVGLTGACGAATL